VGLGAAAPLFAAVTRRYDDAHFGRRPRSRFIALLGDAELDEGNVWEAVADPATQGLGNVTWVVDFNRQSLDRVVPGVGVTLVEPAYAVALDWLLCDSLGRIAAGPSATRTAAPVDDAGAYYFRLTTRPLDQAPFEAARARLGDAVLRRQVLAGAYRLVDAHDPHPELREGEAPVVHLAASGALLPETLAAAAELADEGIAAHVVDVTSLDRLYTAWQRTLRQGVRTATAPSVPGAIRTAFGDRHLVTVHDGASHSMEWMGSALGVPAVPLGVDAFGQSGSVHELYELHDLLPGSIVNAALAALSLR
jgi:pyruvate dehydrogenase E1 component